MDKYIVVMVVLITAWTITACTYSLPPSHKINAENIIINPNYVIINEKNLCKVEILKINSGSMLPTITQDSIVLCKIPKQEELVVGDIVYYEKDGCVTNYNKVLHRIIKTNNDEKGIYYITKGDANIQSDLCKLRFNDIKAVIVGVIY